MPGGSLRSTTPSSFLHATGPCYIWAGVPAFSSPSTPISLLPFSSGNIYYVGTCEANPTTETSLAYNGIFTSESGSRNPYDKEYLGTQEVLVFDFNKFNADIVDILESAPQYGRSFTNLQSMTAGVPYSVQDGTAAGTNSSLDYGTLLIANKGFYQLWIQYSYYNTELATPDLRPGFFYFCCATVAVYIPVVGLRTKKRRLVVEAMNLRDPSGNMAMKTNESAYFLALKGLVPG